MNEAETRTELIDPALKAAGWGVVSGSRIRREFITLGCLQPGNIRANSLSQPGDHPPQVGVLPEAV